jgi:hypothetical protein
MNKKTIIYVAICAAMLCAGIAIGYLIHPKPDPSIDLQHEEEKRVLREEAQAWMDIANQHNVRVDTIIVEREKLKTIKQYEKGLVNASIDSIQQLLLTRPTVE